MKRLFAQFDPRIAEHLHEQRRPIYRGLLCAAGAAGLISLTGLLLKYILKAIGSKNYEQLLAMSLLVLLAFGVKYFLTRGQSYYLSEAASRLTTEVRRTIFERLLRLPVGYFNSKRAGSIQSVLANDVNVYQNAVVALKDSIDGPIRVVVGVGVIFYISWKLTLAAMVVLPFMVLFIQRNSRKMKVAQAQVQDSLGVLTAFMQESLQGTRVIKALGAEEEMGTRFRTYSEQTLQSQLKAARRVATLKPMVEFIGAVALAIVIFLCGKLAQQGELTVDEIAGFVLTLDAINKGIQAMGSLRQTRAQVQAASDRIFREVLDIPEEEFANQGTLTLVAPSGDLEFRNVSFRYPDGTEALRNVSFSVRAGESLALVGASGAGKSTIADLIQRFYDPTEGEILYSGEDIRNYSVEWYRSQIGVVPQTNFLFAGTVAENIMLASPGATAADVNEALRAAHAEEFVHDMDGGVEAELGERGVRLSGGQAQRLSIARALVRKPNLLLLDEATSNLDSVSEKAVNEALDEIMPGRTTVLIAHRLTSAARATKILVLRKGEVLEWGTFRDLMAANGTFAHMYQAFVQGGVLEAL